MIEPISNADFKKFAAENKAFCDSLFAVAVKVPTSFWVTPAGAIVSFSNPKKFRKFLRLHNLGHCQAKGRHLFSLAK
jgi:hypothetical protein